LGRHGIDKLAPRARPDPGVPPLGPAGRGPAPGRSKRWAGVPTAL